MMLALFLASAAVDAPAARPTPPAVATAAEKPIDPAAVAAATRLLGAMHVDQTIDRMMEKLIPLMSTAMVGSLEHEAATQGVTQAIENQPNGRARLMAIFAEEMQKSLRTRYPAIIAASAREYATTFSAAELDQLSAFFATGTGAKWVAQSPALQQAVGAKAGEIGGEAGREAGVRTMQRAMHEIVPPTKTTS